jgi:hypothetical protein
MQEDAELQGACHCGAVRLTLPSRPQKATRCRCVGAVWAYYEFGTVTIHGHPEDTVGYVQGDRTLRTVRCRACGIATHWEPLVPNADNRHGVNLNNFDPALLAQVRVRRFDGADTWTFLDEGTA